MNKIMNYDQDYSCILRLIFTWNNAILYEYKMKILIYGAATYEENHELAILNIIIPVFTDVICEYCIKTFPVMFFWGYILHWEQCHLWRELVIKINQPIVDKK